MWISYFPLQFRVRIDFHRCPAQPHVPQHNGDLVAQVTARQCVKHQFPVVWMVDGHVDSSVRSELYSGRLARILLKSA